MLRAGSVALNDTCLDVSEVLSLHPGLSVKSRGKCEHSEDCVSGENSRRTVVAYYFFKCFSTLKSRCFKFTSKNTSVVGFLLILLSGGPPPSSKINIQRLNDSYKCPVLACLIFSQIFLT